jgi:hypothetical protein
MVTSRIWFTAAQKAEVWERWKNGQSAAPSRERWKGRTRPALSGSWYCMEGLTGAYPRYGLHPELDSDWRRFTAGTRDVNDGADNAMKLFLSGRPAAPDGPL